MVINERENLSYVILKKRQTNKQQKTEVITGMCLDI